MGNNHILEYDLKQGLKDYFGYDNFRHGQEEIIESILKGQDTSVIMPTGGGKSICYQLPALLSEGCSIVFSPLIALMQDQVDTLLQRKIPAAIINSTIDYDKINDIMDRAARGVYKLIYIAPERLQSRRFLEKLEDLTISFIAVDEAHCISQWGHDFRPAYQKISDIFDYIGETPVIALTATATSEVADDIEQSLSMDNPVRFIRGFDRENLSFNVINCEEGREDKDTYLLRLCTEKIDGSIIIYCGSRKRVEECRKFLNDHEVGAEHYHAGLQAIVRKQVQERFISGQTKIIVATNAFGMGIDKSDVRKVIHYDMPVTMEAYYQEAGRAGRDGKKSECCILYSNKDLKLQNFFCEAGHPKYHDLKMIFETLEALIGRNDDYTSDNLTYELAKSTKLFGYNIDKILSILRENGVIRRKSASSGIYVSLLEEKAALREYYKHLHPESQDALRAIMQSLPSEAFFEKTKLNLIEIERKYQLPATKLKMFLRDFSMSGILQFNENQYDAASYSILESDISVLRKIGKQQTVRRNLAYSKLFSMISYCETSQCKRNYILDYFGDTGYKGKCSRCSSCLEDNRILDEQDSLIIIEEQIIKKIGKTNNNFKWGDIVTFFTDRRTKKKKVNNAITYLFRKNILTAEERFETPLQLTEFGNNIYNLIR